MQNRHLINYFAWLVMILSLVLSLGITSDNMMSSHAFFSFANLFVYLISILSWCKLGGRPLSLYVFFVVYAFFSNAGQSVLYSLGAHDIIMYTYMHESINDITRMLRFQLLCVSALNLGACYYMSKHKVISLSEMRVHYNRREREANQYDDILDLLMFLSVAYVGVQCIQMFILRQSMDYGDFFSSGRGVSTNYLAGFFDFFSIILPVRCLLKKKYINFVYFSYFFFISIFMIVGSRGLSIRYLALTMICLPITHPRLFTKKTVLFWVIGFFVGLAGLSIISASRSSVLSLSSFDVSNSLLTGVLNTLDEMGNSERPAILAMTEVDNALGHKQTFLYTFVCGFIPFTSSLSFFQEQYIYLGDYLTKLVDSYSGLGASYIGECYLNYGWLGFIFMFFYGYAIACGENLAYKKILRGDILVALFILAILSRQVAFGRSEFLRLAPLFRTIEIVFIISFLFRKKQ